MKKAERASAGREKYGGNHQNRDQGLECRSGWSVVLMYVNK